MQAIFFPINPKDTGNEVSNLQAALLLLLDKQIIATFQPPDSPDSPTEEEIMKLRGLLEDEEASSLFGDGTRQVVLYFQLQQGLSDKYNGAIEEITAAKMNEILKGLGAFDNTENTFLVKGIISQADGSGFANAIVRAYDCDLRRSDPLGKTTTGKDGYYEISYNLQQSSNAEKGNADVQVLVYKTINDDEKKPLLTSDIFFNAPPVQEINLTLLALPAGKEKSEWQILNEQVLPLLKEQKKVPKALNVFEDLLPEELKQYDFDFIAKETSLDKNNIQLWSLAYLRNKEENRIPPEVFYEWFRMDLPTELKGLWARTNDELSQKLDDAVSKNIIPELSDELKKNLSTILDQVLLDFHLLPAKEGEKPSIGDVLNTLLTKLNANKQLVVAKILLTQPNGESIAEKLKKNNFEDVEIFAVERTLGLQNITQNHLPLIKALQLKKPVEAEASLIDLVKLEPADWLALVKEHGVPETIKGDVVEQNQQLYADQLAHTIEQTLPSAWIEERMKDDRFPIDPTVKDDASLFFKQNPGFQIGKTQVLNYFSNKEQVVLANIKDPENVKKELLKIERIVSCTARLGLAAKIINKGFHSSLSIMQRSKESFVLEMMDGSPGMESQLTSTYRVAQERHAKATVLVTEYIRAKKDSPIAILKHKPETSSSPVAAVGSVSSAATAANDITADLATLFGNLDFCDCEHCSSVYSPAAYMVDLLQMLDSGKQPNNPSPLDVLLARRPDIGEIDLTCDNTNTSVPYIDLALEVLEKQVELFDEDLNALTSFSFSLYNSNNNEEVIFKTSLNTGHIPDSLYSKLTSQGISGSKLNWAVQIGISDNWVKRWILRNNGWKINIKAENDNHGTADSVIYVTCWPQTSASATELIAIPNFVNPKPYSKQLTQSYHPWSLPFDLWREETNAWLKQIGIDRNILIKSFSHPDRLRGRIMATDFIGLSKAEVVRLIKPIKKGWRVWGIDSDTIEALKDMGQESDWINLLKPAFNLREKAGLSQRELMNLLEIRFIQTTYQTTLPKIELSGDECNATKMELQNLEEAHLKRIHIFVRLWRKIGWSMFDVDRAIIASPQAYTRYHTFNPRFLIFLANIEQVRKLTGLPISIILNWHTGLLDTHSYNDSSEGKIKVLPSPYESLFYDRSVSRSRDNAFELAPGTDPFELALSPVVTLRSKLLPVAAALSVKPTELTSFLTKSVTSIPLISISQAMNGSSVDCGLFTNAVFELDLRQLQGTIPSFTIELQHADRIGAQFSAIPANEVDPGQPIVITNPANPQVFQIIYKGSKPILRIAITSASGILTMAGKITSDRLLSLNLLSKLTRYTSLAKAFSLAVNDLLLAIKITAINPFSSPKSTLNFWSKLQLIRSSGFSLYDLDYLLRHQSLKQATIALSSQKTSSVLTEIRQGLQKITEDTAQQIDERGEITKKWLSSLQWNSKLVDELLGPDYLGRGRIESNYFANHLPHSIILPSSIKYDPMGQKLSIVTQPHAGASLSPISELDLVLQQMSAPNPDDLNLRTTVNNLKNQVQNIAGPETNYDGTIPHGLVLPLSISINGANHKISVSLTPDSMTDLESVLNHLTAPADKDLIAAINNLKTQVENIKDPETKYVGHDFPLGIALTANAGVAYEETTKKLYLNGVVTSNQLADLKDQTRDAEFIAAINNLIEQIVPAEATALAIRGRMISFNQPEYSIPLALFSISIPSVFSGRFFYRPEEKALVYIGLMTADERDILKTLDATNAVYTEAIRNIYTASNPPVIAPDSETEFINLSSAKKLLYESQTPQERYEKILTKLLPFIKKQLNSKLLVEKLSTGFTWDPSFATQLLEKVKLPSVTTPLSQIFLDPDFAGSDAKVLITPAGFEKQFKAMELLYKTGLIFTRLSIKPEQTNWIYDNTWLDLPDLNLLPLLPSNNSSFRQWVNLVLLMKLRDKWPGGEMALNNYTIC